VNWLLAAGTLGAVITFGSSDALGGAYGIAVSMLEGLVGAAFRERSLPGAAVHAAQLEPEGDGEGIEDLRRNWHAVRRWPLPPDLARDYTRYIDKHLWWFGQGPPSRPRSVRERQLATAIQDWFAGRAAARHGHPGLVRRALSRGEAPSDG
jgi:hypothetical protein